MMVLDPLLLGHGLLICLFFLLLIDEEISGSVLHEEKVSLIISDLSTLINSNLFLLDCWLLLFLPISIIGQLLSGDLSLGKQTLCLLFLLKHFFVGKFETLDFFAGGLTKIRPFFRDKGFLDLDRSVPLFVLLFWSCLGFRPDD